MGGTVWTNFYWADHSDDKGLKLCSFAAQGLWMRMQCIAADHQPIGFVAVKGEKLEPGDIARLCGGDLAQVEPLIAELERYGVFSRDRRGCIYSRRMVRDAQNSARHKKNGKKGGNPSLSKTGNKSPPDNPPLNREVKPQRPETNNQKNLLPKDSVSVPRGPDTRSKAVRKQLWEQKIITELRHRKGADEVERIVDAYQRGDPDAKLIFEDIDRDLKKRKRAA